MGGFNGLQVSVIIIVCIAAFSFTLLMMNKPKTIQPVQSPTIEQQLANEKLKNRLLLEEIARLVNEREMTQ